MQFYTFLKNLNLCSIYVQGALTLPWVKIYPPILVSVFLHDR